jgi:hypothetical protein
VAVEQRPVFDAAIQFMRAEVFCQRLNQHTPSELLSMKLLTQKKKVKNA